MTLTLLTLLTFPISTLLTSLFLTINKKNRRGPPPAPPLQLLRPSRPARYPTGNERRKPPSRRRGRDALCGLGRQQRRARRSAPHSVFRAAPGRRAEGAADACLARSEGRRGGWKRRFRRGIAERPFEREVNFPTFVRRGRGRFFVFPLSFLSFLVGDDGKSLFLFVFFVFLLLSLSL